MRSDPVVDSFSGSERQPTFHICTLVTDALQYDAMQRSFRAAGFTESNSRFSMFDNCAGGAHEPYSAINKAIKTTHERYLIFCHQDIRIADSESFEHLLSILTDLDLIDAQWAVCGNAGATPLGVVLHLTDPYGDHVANRLPLKVDSLDENFLVIRVASGVQCSRRLRGFHLYGADICLNAQSQDRSAYVVGFKTIHLSGGTISPEFRACLSAFRQRWQSYFLFRYLRTTCCIILLSKFGALRLLLGNSSACNWIGKHPRIVSRMNAISRGIGP